MRFLDEIAEPVSLRNKLSPLGRRGHLNNSEMLIYVKMRGAGDYGNGEGEGGLTAATFSMVN